jgi:hypothetical protein
MVIVRDGHERRAGVGRPSVLAVALRLPLDDRPHARRHALDLPPQPPRVPFDAAQQLGRRGETGLGVSEEARYQRGAQVAGLIGS